MLKLVFSILRRFLFWMLFFAFTRGVFMLYYARQIKHEGIEGMEILKTFYHALALDLATACYILALPFFLLLFQALTSWRLFLYIEKLYSFIVILVFALIVSSELGLYAEWQTKLSYKALSYLQNPDEVFNTVPTLLFIWLVVIWALISSVSIWIYHKWIANEAKRDKPALSAFYTLLIFPGLLFLGMRGGFQEIPITTSASYFSSHNILNLSAANSGYNILHSILDSSRLGTENRFSSMDQEKALQIVHRLHHVEKDSTPSILQVKNPNIVVVLLESWSADLIESLGGKPGISPNFKKLEAGGLLFTEFYASANRSQHAMSSLYGGLPGLPITTLTNHPEKYAALPSFVKDLNEQGYFTSFYFGGQLIYGNILSYLYYNEFDRIIEGKDLDPDFYRGKLGVHDVDMLTYYATALNDHPQPFFSTVFTNSSHSPYDHPMEDVIHWPEIEKPYVNSAFYSDKALGIFFDLAKQQSWYDSTLFVIQADHSHRSYRNHPLRSFEHHKIPLMFYGPALKPEYRGKTFGKLAGNVDVPATLMKQLDMPANAYFWSKNILNHYYDPFAFFAINEGLGWKRPEGEFVWNVEADHYYVKNIEADEEQRILQEGKAYLQLLFEEFMGY